jgi:hypothetical protein
VTLIDDDQVDDDQVKEPPRKLLEELLALLRTSDRLIEAKINLKAVSIRRFLSRASGTSSVLPSARSIVLAFVLSFAMAAPNGRKSLTMV